MDDLDLISTVRTSPVVSTSTKYYKILISKMRVYFVRTKQEFFLTNLVYRKFAILTLNSESKLFYGLCLAIEDIGNLFARIYYPLRTIRTFKLIETYGDFCVIMNVVFRELRFAYFNENCSIILSSYDDSNDPFLEVSFIRHVPSLEIFPHSSTSPYCINPLGSYCLTSSN